MQTPVNKLKIILTVLIHLYRKTINKIKINIITFLNFEWFFNWLLKH